MRIIKPASHRWFSFATTDGIGAVPDPASIPLTGPRYNRVFIGSGFNPSSYLVGGGIGSRVDLAPSRSSLQ